MPTAKLQEVLSKTTTGEAKASVTPTAETKTIAGFTCKVHEVSVEVPFSHGRPGDADGAGDERPACLSKDAPGYADYLRLYTDYRREGLHPRRSARRPGPRRGDGQGHDQLPEDDGRGRRRPRAEHARRAEGRGPDGRHDGRMFKIDSGHVVTKIETGDLDAALFEVPAGFKVKQN